jgi:pSer/pThr/pTyr-binding forkhead associated (FHA) protein/tRNA A-37 threonylcarbamoyl transferase component Bud32
MAGDQLHVTEGNDRGKPLSVDGELLIGRAATEEEGRLGDDPELSRRHALVTRSGDGQLTIQDLGSANGTFVNDARIEGPRALRPGDMVRLGRTLLEVIGEPVSAPGHELVITAGAGEGRRLRVGEQLELGREVKGDGRLRDDPELSRHHARVTRDAGGGLTIEDLGSANGTFVNGAPVHGRRALELGDSILVGSTTLRLVATGQAPPAPAPVTPPPPAPVRPQPPPTPAAPTPQLAPGTVFAGCSVEQVIGHGDMGVVYRAEELALQRRVALKLIRPEHSGDERFRERFRREATAAAAIDHPNVIPLFDAGEESGVLYLTMRLVEGTDLRALIAAEGRVDPLRAAQIVRQVGAALDAAHARGMLHRDVKPSNVLLGREDHAYLTDFGLAKPLTSSAGLTRHGTVVARAQYVAPEQILHERVDARADIYALGCVLFEALTGERPVGADVRVDAPPPSVRKLRPDLPEEFDTVVARAMARDPADRFSSAGDLGHAALVAAGGLRRARLESVVATGPAAFSADGPGAEEEALAAERPAAAGQETLRWVIAIGALLLVAVGMVAALHGISTL